MKTNCITNVSFCAKISAFDLPQNNAEILKLFNERTREYPGLTLKLDRTSSIGDDHFILIDNRRIIGEKSASYSNNLEAYTSVDDTVNRFVKIFKSIIKDTLKK